MSCRSLVVASIHAVSYDMIMMMMMMYSVWEQKECSSSIVLFIDQQTVLVLPLCGRSSRLCVYELVWVVNLSWIWNDFKSMKRRTRSRCWIGHCGPSSILLSLYLVVKERAILLRLKSEQVHFLYEILWWKKFKEVLFLPERTTKAWQPTTSTTKLRCKI